MTFVDSLDTWVLAASAHPAVAFLAQEKTDGPVGPEFGKASPIGLLILVLMGVAVIMAGWFFHRRYSRFRRRTMFAEDHGLDPFNEEAIDAAMKEAGIFDNSKKSYF